MREIKFRAWDKENNKWIYFTIDEAIAKNNHTFLSNIGQFTGLKDKNNVEIYEGDIVKDVYPAGYRTYEIKFGEFDNGEDYEDREYGNGWYLQSIFEHYFVEKWKEQSYDKFDNSEIKIIEILEVMGNVFENPELLAAEAKKDS
jgi:uncharacterized phage protein (TIGR01671 family)